ncbi:MAG: hypothetical protein AAB875_03395 [Patescibacteria group bacterium]
MNTVSNLAIGTQTKFSSSRLSVSDKAMEVRVSDYIPDVSQEPDRFELGDYSGKETVKTNLVLINGELFEIDENHVQQEGSNSDLGIFKTT